MSLLEFVSNAPCRESDPWLFDQYQLDLAQPGLQHCKGCPFWQNCEDLVQPKSSYYDGICGGKVWRNGRVLASLHPTLPHKLKVGLEEDEVFIDVNAVEFRGGELR